VARTRRWTSGLLLCALVLAGCTSVADPTIPRPTIAPGSISTTSIPSTSSVPVAGATITGSSPTGSTGAPSTSRSTPSTPSTPAPSLSEQHDAVARQSMATAAAALGAGRRAPFLAAFPGPLQHRLANWYANYRALGVAAARFTVIPDAASGTKDTATSFSRSVIVGVRSPYDDPASLPGFTYRVAWALAKDRTAWQISAFAPQDADDPMNCDCTLQVGHTGQIAVVSRTADDLGDWPDLVLGRGVDARAWLVDRLPGSGLRAPAGTVLFLAAQPYPWFLRPGSPGEKSNSTFQLLDAGGAQPGTRLSRESRIVIALSDSAGHLIDAGDVGLRYVSDVTAHEMVHQLFGFNDETAQPPPAWAIEGVAVGMETLHRRSTDEDDGVYPQPDDPANIDPGWLRTAVKGPLPTRMQLYQGDVDSRLRWYALSGSVFLYLQATYGTPAMLGIARSMYAAGRAPWVDFPDPAHPGHTLTEAAAQAAWRAWVQRTYLR
jgi:hypothetical protein